MRKRTLAALLATATVALGVGVSRHDWPKAVDVPRSAARNCEPRTGGPHTVPDAAVIGRVDHAWSRIETWLNTNAPVSAAALRPPAPPSQVVAIQDTTGYALPADMMASWLRHDGTEEEIDLFPPYYYLLPAERIPVYWHNDCLNGGPGWSDTFVPVGSNGLIGYCLYIDAKEPAGSQGYLRECGGSEDGYPSTVLAMLESVAAALEAGEHHRGRYRAKVSNGRLSWRRQR